MALADTARLIVELALRDRLSGGLGKVDRNVSRLNQGMGTLTTRTQNFGARTVAVGIGLERLAEIGLRGLVGGIRTGVEEMQRLEDANLQTAAALKSTNGVSGQTVEGIRAMAEAYEGLNATVDDKAIQEAANKLLTFTKVGGDIFDDALESALDLSTRLEGDVQGAIIQVGKALQDPVRGVTALRRAGVQLTEQQEKQIKTLVEQNDLYGAQKIILAELNTQVGGSFAAQGRGDAARAAALRDRIEDLQRVLATGLAPGLTRVREALISAFDNPAVINGVRTIGENIANFLSAENLKAAGGVAKDVFGFLAAVPWGTIGDGLRIVGTGARVAVEAFRSLPKEVQGVIVAGLAVNRLSGGLAGSLAATGIKALFNSLKTITAANVTVIGGNVTGGPGIPGVGGKGGGFLGGLGKGLLTGGVVGGAAVAVGAAAVTVTNFQDMRTEAMGGLQNTLDNMPRDTAAELDASIARIEGEIAAERPFLDGILFNTNVKPQLEAELEELQNLKTEQARSTAAARDAIPWLQRNRDEIRNFNQSEGTRWGATIEQARTQTQRQAEQLAVARAANSELVQIKNKKANVNVTFNSQTNVAVSASLVANGIRSINSTITGNQQIDEILL